MLFFFLAYTQRARIYHEYGVNRTNTDEDAVRWYTSS